MFFVGTQQDTTQLHKEFTFCIVELILVEFWN